MNASQLNPGSSERSYLPLITIGLTSYNSAETIERAIKSALSQDWSNFELLIVDDCSSDSSPKTIERCIDRARHARLIRHTENRGPAAARNTLLEQSRGDFVVFFDDDDESHPNRLRTQYERLLAYEAETAQTLVACFASGARRYPNGYELHIAAIGSEPEVPRGEIVADYLLFNRREDDVFYGRGTPTCALMARKSTFEYVGNFDSQLRRVEDVDFAIRLSIAGAHFVGCPETLYLQHATEAPDKTPLMNLESELKLVEKHAEYLKRKHRYHYARDWFKIRFLHFSGDRVRFLFALAYFLIRFPVSGLRHLLRSGPRRLRHKRKMAQNS